MAPSLGRAAYAVDVDIQVQQVPGATLAQLKAPIEQAIAESAPNFSKLSGRDVEVHGIAAYELMFTYTDTGEGTPHQARMLVYKPDDTLYMVTSSSSVEDRERFEPEFAAREP